jgi:micrococcal nuclease
MYKILSLFLLFAFAAPAPVKPAAYKIIAIADGDTFTILQNNKQVRIRLDAIDAPERGMPYYKKSKQYLSALCFGKQVRLKVKETDRYGRFVARALLADGRDVSSEMIRAGMAWHYKQYSSDKTLSSLETQARSSKAGLWRDPHPVAPWEVRKLHRNGVSTKNMFPLTSSDR